MHVAGGLVEATQIWVCKLYTQIELLQWNVNEKMEKKKFTYDFYVHSYIVQFWKCNTYFIILKLVEMNLFLLMNYFLWLKVNSEIHM